MARPAKTGQLIRYHGNRIARGRASVARAVVEEDATSRSTLFCFAPRLLYSTKRNNTSMPTIRLIGCRRTATNATAKYLEHCFNANIILNGRHGVPQRQERLLNNLPDNGYDGVAITTKNPWAWLVSIQKWTSTTPSHAPRFYQQLIDLWATKHDAFARWADQRDDVAIFPAEAWLTRKSGQSMIQQAEKVWNIAPQNTFEGPKKRDMSPRNARNPEPFNPDYYLNHEYMNELNDHATTIKNSLQTPWIRDIVENWGYSTHPPR